MTTEQEQFEQQLAELRAKYPDVCIMGKHGIKYLTLITEGKDYEPKEEGPNNE